ncbi:hypothetical protein PRIPAC_92523 [Pristionchus pacificus]|uniref:Uncharacterized protein n=1 Tax=Pristionchus pacificus TaxID=54126 RepID=A0A2A6BIL9_PRIPA|nr:hypothetical protein PRIPAC_92523 [Pristionchus pacificus]|eukprot:PDM65678.1 hypothetical protein PRIPAC_45592 [Pristionchus pacificus]
MGAWAAPIVSAPAGGSQGHCGKQMKSFIAQVVSCLLDAISVNDYEEECEMVWCYFLVVSCGAQFVNCAEVVRRLGEFCSSGQVDLQKKGELCATLEKFDGGLPKELRVLEKMQ